MGAPRPRFHSRANRSGGAPSGSRGVGRISAGHKGPGTWGTAATPFNVEADLGTLVFVGNDHPMTTTTHPRGRYHNYGVTNTC